MLSGGVPLLVVAERLGHTTSTTTARVYAHYVPAIDQAAADDHGATLD